MPQADSGSDRASLMAALVARRLDRTLTTSLPQVDPRDEFSVGPTGLALLDERLGGGFPRGQLSEMIGPRSSGRTSVLLRTIAAATARGELVALVDTLDRFDPESAVAAGIALDRLLWIRGHVVANPGLCRDTNQRAMEQAMRALTLVLQAGNFGLVAFDAGDAPVEALGHLPFTTWLRLQRLVEGRQTLCLLVGTESMARSSAGLTVQLGVRGAECGGRGAECGGRSAECGVRSAGIRFRGRLFEGLDIDARVVRARARMSEDVAVPFSTSAINHA